MSREDFEPLVWAAKQIPRLEAERWWQAGFNLGEALRWRETFDVDEAAAWRAAGVSTPGEARSWRVAGVAADAAGAWREAGIGFAEAAAWNEFGYSLGEAAKLKAEGKAPSDSFRRRVRKLRHAPRPAPAARSGMAWISGAPGVGAFPAMRFMANLSRTNPAVAHSYYARQWFDDEALAWAEAGIDAADAMAWKEFGIAPDEAARLAKDGQTAMSAVRAWWAAGIPIDEVADWLGAGLTPEEAAAQRAKGVSADRAAVLRALRERES